MMQQPITTQRLTLRPFERTDEDAAFAFFSDPEVMQFSLNGVHTSRKPTEDFIIANMKRQDRQEFSIWAVVEQESDALIGMCGLADFGHGIPGVELAYRLRRDKWGQGYASEAAEGAIEYAFTQADLDRLIAAVEPDNLASVHVLEKTGFVRVSRRSISGKDAFLLELTRDDWLTRHIQEDRD